MMSSASTPLKRQPLEVVPVSALSDNYIWLLSNGREVVVVDPGEAQPVINVIEARDWVLSAILLTHHHADHVAGVSALLSHHAGRTDDLAAIPVYGPAREKIAHVTHRLSDGDGVRIERPDLTFSVLDVPGHTAGHIAYFLSADAASGPGDAIPGAVPGAEAEKGQGTPRVFCGDTLFATGCGRLFEGTPAQMQSSLDRLAALPERTKVHCAHEYTLSNIRFALACDAGNAALHAWRERAEGLRSQGAPTIPTTIGDERLTNPFLRTETPAIIASLALRLGRKPANRLEAFAALRSWKDQF